MALEVLISGATGHIGHAIVQRLAADPRLRLYVTARHVATLRQIEQALPGARSLACDLLAVDAMAQVAAWLRHHEANPTALVCAHGVADQHDSATLTTGHLLRVLHINLVACLHLAQLCYPSMAEAGWGRVVFISSIHGQQTYPRRAAYAISKGGLEALARVLALEWAPQGITVNCIAPGQLDTPMQGSPLTVQDLAPVRAATPTGALTTARQVASLAGWLLSEEAANITGQVIRMDGGIGIHGMRGNIRCI